VFGLCCCGLCVTGPCERSAPRDSPLVEGEGGNVDEADDVLERPSRVEVMIWPPYECLDDDCGPILELEHLAQPCDVVCE